MQMGSAGAGWILLGPGSPPRGTSLVAAAQPADVAATAISPSTLRITVLPAGAVGQAYPAEDGALVATDAPSPVRQYTGEAVDGPATLVVYPGAPGHGGWYQDDGHTLDYRRGGWSRMLTAWDDSRHRLRLSLADGSQAPAQARRLAGEARTHEVAFDGRPVEIEL